MTKQRKRRAGTGLTVDHYDRILADIAGILEDARYAAARSVNAVMTTTYWWIGWRILEHEQGGQDRAGYGQKLLKQLSRDLTARFGRGFSLTNLKQFRKFYLVWRVPEKGQTASDQLPRGVVGGKGQTPSDQSSEALISSTDGDPTLPVFPLSWSHYVRLMSVQNDEARRFYETEALRGGWTTRQLHRQIGTQFYERTALSKNKAAMLQGGEKSQAGDKLAPEEAIKDPYTCWSSSTSGTSTPSLTWKKHSSNDSRNSCWNWAPNSPSSVVSAVCESGIPGTA